MAALIPDPWRRFPGLVCGFGDRSAGPPSAVVTAVQVHGVGVVEADDDSHADLEADGLWVGRPGRIVAVKTADCVPILLVAADHHWAAAVHAGWRGTLARIAGAAVAHAAAAPFSIGPQELHAAIGPAIGRCCYEVGEEVAVPFDEAGLPVLRRNGVRLDLREINRHILIAAGLRPSRIQVCGPCTRCRADLYYSYRAAPYENGRQLSWVGWADQRQGTGQRENP